MRNVLLDLKSRNVPVILLSDANTFYIDTILNVSLYVFVSLESV